MYLFIFFGFRVKQASVSIFTNSLWLQAGEVLFHMLNIHTLELSMGFIYERKNTVLKSDLQGEKREQNHFCG